MCTNVHHCVPMCTNVHQSLQQALVHALPILSIYLLFIIINRSSIPNIIIIVLKKTNVIILTDGFQQQALQTRPKQHQKQHFWTTGHKVLYYID